MQIHSLQLILASSLFNVLVASLPFHIEQLIRRKAPSYSVVQVDGGSDAAGGSIATTVIETQDSTETVTDATTVPTTQIITSTIIQTQHDSPTTVLVTITQEETPTASATPSPTTVPAIANPTTSEGAPAANTPAESIATTVLSVSVPSPTTVILSPSPSSTAYYDDGMWHTHYPVKESSTPLASTTLTSASISTTSVGAMLSEYQAVAENGDFQPQSQVTSATSLSPSILSPPTQIAAATFTAPANGTYQGAVRR